MFQINKLEKLSSVKVIFIEVSSFSSNVLFIAFGKESFTVTLNSTRGLVLPWSVILNPKLRTILSSIIWSIDEFIPTIPFILWSIF